MDSGRKYQDSVRLWGTDNCYFPFGRGESVGGKNKLEKKGISNFGQVKQVTAMYRLVMSCSFCTLQE